MGDWHKADIRMALWGDWWYFAGAFNANYQSPTMKVIGRSPGPLGIVFAVVALSDEPNATAVSIGEITFIGQEGEMQVFISWPSPAAESFWRGVEAFLKQMSGLARAFQREALSKTFTIVLDDYYARKARGESPSLREMAREARVNYGSLRQAKVRYDKKRDT